MLVDVVVVEGLGLYRLRIQHQETSKATILTSAALLAKYQIDVALAHIVERHSL